MSITKVLHDLPSWKPQYRQALVRKVMELDEAGLTPEELKLAETRLEAHKKGQMKALEGQTALRKLRATFKRIQSLQA
jgi:hypothetical protein